MSMEYVLALAKPIPTSKKLAAAFADLGGIEGSLKDRLDVGTSRVESRPRSDDVEALLGDALSSAGHPAIGEHLFFTLTGSDDCDEVGSKLVELAGGAFMTEDGELLHYVATPAPAPRPTKSRALDVSIPRDVLRRFTSQAQYCLYARKAPTARIPALVKAAAVPTEKRSYAKYAGTTSLVLGIGAVHLNEYGDAGYWESEFKSLGLRAPQTLFRTAFEAWHVQSVPGDDWKAMLSVVCGLARTCDGIIYRPGGSHFDFTLPEVPEPIVGDEPAEAARLVEQAKTSRGAALAEEQEGRARPR